MRHILLLLACAVATLAYSPLEYVGDQVLAITPDNQQQVETLQLWREKGLFGKEKVFLDFWSSPNAPGSEFQVHVKRSDAQDVREALDSHGIVYRVANPDFGRVIAQESDMNSAAFNDHTRYLKYDEYHATARALITKCGSQCSREVIGKSFEGREIVAYKLGNNAANPVFFLEAGVHAREWIAPATALYIIDQVISNPTHRALLNKWNLVIVGLSNPDGYEFSHTKDRMWRKNRRPGSSCTGVDLNRNFGFKFGGKGTSTSQCSDIYRGTGGFSEPETQAIRAFVVRNKAAIKAYWSVHSYGQWWLHPWGYENSIDPTNVKNLKAAAAAGAEALRQVNGRSYTIGHSADLLYPAAGGSDDWALSEGIPYAYTVELPDSGRYGFILPPSFIIPVGQETLAGLKAFLNAI